MGFIKKLSLKDNSNRLLVVVYCGFIILTEMLGVFLGVFWGLISSAVLLLVLLNHYVIIKDKISFRILPALAFLPLIRIISYATPVNDLPPYYWHLILGIPIAVGLLLAGRTLQFPWKNWKLDVFPWRSILLIALSGIPLGYLGYSIQAPQNQGTGSNLGLILITAVILLVFAAALEEILFRGLLADALSDIFDPWSDIVVNVLYAAMFISSLSFAMVVFMGLVGGFFSFCVKRTGTLWAGILANWVLKVGLLLIWPLILS